ncbi:MAG: sialate O-acetylesterase [Spirochaetales bacterium]|nr:sialate O-acetylesterase [Spirochaetales bacterium]
MKKITWEMSTMMMTAIGTLTVLFSCFSCNSLGSGHIIQSKITLASVFTTNMVIQREKQVPVWGNAQPGKTIKVTFAGQEKTAPADKNGSWMVYLDPMEASFDSREMTMDYLLTGKDEIQAGEDFSITLRNILVGEIWFCSGQSNMEMGMSAIYDRKNELKDVTYPEIRLSLIAKDAKPFPAEKISFYWEESSREAMTTGGWYGFSAVAFTFGRKLFHELKVPVGLIQSAYGGSPVHPWVPPEELKSFPVFTRQYAMLEKANRTYAEEKKKNKEAKHPFEGMYDYSQLKPATLYNAMVFPVVPFAIRGVLWYQGESNIGDGTLYTEKMNALITGWRRIFAQGDFPFYFVQLPPYNYGNDALLPKMWEAQEACLSIPQTGMVTGIDTGDLIDIHPKQKRTIGERLALLAMVKTYGRNDIVYSGPVYKEMHIDGSTAVISFTHAGSGLVSGDGKPLAEFTIAGADMKFVPASASISGNTVLVKSEDIPAPVAVRFAWRGSAKPNLFNKEGFPAWPFRTD